MTSTISDFMPQLLTHSEIQELVQTHFEDQAAQILQGMEQGSLGRDQSEELDGLLTSFIIDHGEEVVSFKGHGGSARSSRDAMAYLQEHHPQAANLMQTQARELQRLLGKDGAAAALGQKRKPFAISVLCWGPVYIVLAEDFESAYFKNEKEAISFAQINYKPFLSGVVGQSHKLDPV